MIFPVGVAVLGVCNCASGRGPMSQGGFSDYKLPMESSRHREILKAQRALMWRNERVARLPSVPQSDLHPTAASELQHSDRRRRNNTPDAAQIPPPLRQHTTTAPLPRTTYTTTLAAPPCCSGESPPRLHFASCSEPRARMCLPTPAAPSHICAKRAHRPSILSESAAASTRTECLCDGTHS